MNKVIKFLLEIKKMNLVAWKVSGIKTFLDWWDRVQIPVHWKSGTGVIGIVSIENLFQKFGFKGKDKY